MNKLLLLFFTPLLLNCVGPADPDHGLVENLPAVINKNDVFSFVLRADGFNYDKSFDLSLAVPSNKLLLSTLVITDFNSQDSSTIQIIGQNDTLVYSYLIKSNITVTSNHDYLSPKISKVRLNNFSGIIDWVVTAN
ncbi:MAG: hypothetical protein VYB52_01005 [Candidatus Neomarinimicrobiota bacterium]|nr:hypothetical protein [Candidatus Neomarinimicrobiota bacterium]